MRWFVLIGAWMTAALFTLDCRVVQAHEIPGFEETYIQGVFSPKFTPPAAGTYDLPVIRQVQPFAMIDAAGRHVTTGSLTHGKVAVVSFVYTACTDRLGCPLASMALRELQAQLKQEGLQDTTVLLSISLDPVRDTPAQLAKYGRAFGAEPSFWHLLTAPSERVRNATLKSFGQDLVKIYDERDRFTGRYRHVLKVFLVDQAGNIRNIYSTGSLVPQVIVNDIKTVLADKTADQPALR